MIEVQAILRMIEGSPTDDIPTTFTSCYKMADFRLFPWSTPNANQIRQHEDTYPIFFVCSKPAACARQRAA